MSTKTEKLAQRLQEIQQFVSNRINQDRAYIAINQSLKKLEYSLKEGKLVVQIASHDLAQAQTLKKLLATSNSLREVYEFKAAALLTQSESAPLPVPVELILEKTLTRYQLSTHQSQIIGRHPACQIRLPDKLALVSGRHAELQALPNSHSHDWQICDLDSRHGTYINGQRLTSCHILQPNDKIVFGSLSASAESAALVFECHSQKTNIKSNDKKKYNNLFNTDILCLVIEPNQQLSKDEQELIERFSQTQITKLFIVVVLSPEWTTVPENFKKNLTEIAAWMNAQPERVRLELIPLLLHSFSSSPGSPGATVITPHAQLEFEHFCDSLETLSKGKTEEMVIQRFTTQLLWQVIQIEHIINIQEQELKQKIQQQESEWGGTGIEGLKEKLTKVVKKAGEDKDKVFKQIKQEVNQSKGALLDSFSKRSIFCKIQQFTNELELVLTQKGNFKKVQLQSQEAISVGSINLVMINLCRSQLVQWTQQEWERVCNTYAEGGLQGLHQRNYEALNFIPSLNSRDWLFQAAKKLNPEKSLQDSIVEPTFETQYRNSSLFDYMLKQVRSQAMQFGMASTLSVGFISTMAFLITQLVKPGSPTTNQNQQVQVQLSSGISNELRMPLVFFLVFTVVFLIIVLVRGLVNAYHQDEEIKLKDITTKLKKDLCNFYQSLAKNFVEKLIQQFNNHLDVEEQKASKALEKMNEQIKIYLETLKYQQNIYKKQKDKLEIEKSELEKFKRV